MSMKLQTKKTGWRELAVQGVVLFLLLVALFPRVFFAGEVAVPGTLLFDIDPWRQHAPEEYRPTRNITTLETLIFVGIFRTVQDSFQEGEWPLWSHLLSNTGMPRVGSYQSAIFYPPHAILPDVEVFTCMTIWVLSKLWLCGMVAFLCGRAMGFNRGLACFLSVAWMLGSYNVLWSYWPLPDLSVWLPLLFLSSEWLLSRQYRRGFFAMALAATMLLFAGHPESAFTMSVMVGLYFCIRLGLNRPRGRDLWLPPVWACSAWALGVAVSAVQLLPFLEFVLFSNTFGERANPDALKYFVPASALVSMWVPRFFGATPDGNYWSFLNSNSVSTLYAGIAVWVGAVLLLCRGSLVREQKHRVIALLVPCVLSVMLAVNAPGASYINKLPLFSSMRAHYHHVTAMWGLPVLAATGLAHWFSRKRQLQELLWSVGSLALIAVAVYGLYAFHRPVLVMEGKNGYVLRQILTAGGLCLVTLGILVAGSLLNRPKLATTLVTILLACDLLYAARDFLPTSPREQVFPETDLTRMIREMDSPPPRLSVQSTPIAGGLLAAYRLEQLWGYEAIFTERIMRFFHEGHRRDWLKLEPLCSVGTYLFPPGYLNPEDAKPRYRLADTVDNVEVYENTMALPRAFLVGQVQAVSDVETMFEVMCGPDADLLTTALTEAPPRQPLPDEPGGDLGLAHVRERQANKVVVEVQSERAACLVLTDVYFPGWRVLVDGEPAELFPVYYAFRGVIVPGGKHTVEYVYSPLSFKLGMAISVCALLSSAAGALWVARKS